MNNGVKYADILKWPILILSPDRGLAQQIHGYYTSRPDLEAAAVLIVDDTAAAIDEALQAGKNYSLIFLDVELAAYPCDALYTRVAEGDIGPSIILTETNHPMEQRCRELDAPYFLDKRLVGPESLEPAIVGAAQHFGLQTALKRSEHRFRSMAETMGEALLFVRKPEAGEETDPAHYQLRYYNPAAHALFFEGMAGDDILNQPLGEVLKLSCWADVARLIRRTTEKNITTEAELRYQGQDAELGFVTRWLEVQAVPSGHDVAVLFKNVTEKRLAEERLRLSEQRFHDVADHPLWRIVHQQLSAGRPQEDKRRFFGAVRAP